MKPSPLIEWKNVSYSYETKPVLEKISLAIFPGQFAGIVGPSGAGKTTLFKTLLGTANPTKGSLHKQNLRIGYVPQLESIDWNFPATVEEVVLMGSKNTQSLFSFTKPEERQKAKDILDKLSIGHLLTRHIRNLSGGQQQRVFLARALIAEPDILLLDEPTMGLDVKSRDDILHLLVELNKGGYTILLTTHDLNAVASHLPWIVCLNKSIIAQGKPDDIFHEDILNKTFCANLMVLRKGKLLFVVDKPHGHAWSDL